MARQAQDVPFDKLRMIMASRSAFDWLRMIMASRSAFDTLRIHHERINTNIDV